MFGWEKESDAALQAPSKCCILDSRRLCIWESARCEPFEWLDRAYGMHDAGPFWAKVEPLLKNCTATRDIPRFLTKENLPA